MINTSQSPNELPAEVARPKVRSSPYKFGRLKNLLRLPKLFSPLRRCIPLCLILCRISSKFLLLSFLFVQPIRSPRKIFFYNSPSLQIIPLKTAKRLPPCKELLRKFFAQKFARDKKILRQKALPTQLKCSRLTMPSTARHLPDKS